MKQADVVIGANFGDEGKGLFTDYAAARYGRDGLVVRFNGGAQAGHTVTTPEGQRHVFSHFGSGTLAGAATYLSRFFVCNPLLFGKELHRLREQQMAPLVYVDSQCPLTTPYDMMVNQIVEESRGGARHGSCGVGFGETLERTEKSSLRLRVGNAADSDFVARTLRTIRARWLPQRLAALGVATVSEQWQRRLANDEIIDGYLLALQNFYANTIVCDDGILQKQQAIVFEGAQGLLLDQDRGFFPHVTRSHTGVRNVLALAGTTGIDRLNITYATRSYLTRHGAGPLPAELTSKPYAAIEDSTNIPNDFQGALRFAYLDADVLASAIATDLADARGVMDIRTTLGVSCMDQLDAAPVLILGGQPMVLSPADFITAVAQRIGITNVLASHGPTRATIAPLAVQMAAQGRCAVGQYEFA
jgi:adenylosuccinate synthase